MDSFVIKTLGCKVNQYESQAIRERLEQQGLKEAIFGKSADLCIINTCSVTEVADRKSRNAIRHLIRKYNSAKILVTGCLVNLDAKALSEKIKGIDYIIPKSFFADGVSSFFGHTRAFVKIQDGCNLRCSFCKVPLVRGRSRSRQAGEIIEEAKKLTERGFKEIVLTGICLGDFKDLTGLISKLENIDKLKRIRLSSIEPKFINKQLIDLMASSAKLCPHLHIPLQSGDNKILKLMNRQYTREDFLSLVENLKKKVAGIGISTDVLVGFPQEDEDAFMNTLDVLNQVIPLRVHRFLYSPRQGTLAANNVKLIANRVDLNRRMEEVRGLSEELALKFCNSFLGKELDILVEENCNGLLSGYSCNYLRVTFSATANDLNRVVSVRINKVTASEASGLAISRRE